MQSIICYALESGMTFSTIIIGTSVLASNKSQNPFVDLCDSVDLGNDIDKQHTINDFYEYLFREDPFDRHQYMRPPLGENESREKGTFDR